MQNDIQRGEDIQKLLSLLQQNKSLQVFREAFTNAEDLEEFAGRAKFAQYEQGELVIRQGEAGNNFFIVLDGQLRAVDVTRDPPQLLAYHVAGELVGLRALLGDKIRTATVEVVTPARLAYFDEDDWYWLIGRNSQLRDFFEDLEKSRVQQASVNFPGKQWDEVVVIATKRHFIAYVATLPLPLTLLIAPILFVLAAEITGIRLLNVITETLPLIAMLPFIILAILLALYNYFDWRNDDFIVTTKRAIHIERILFFGEQRRDAPLTRIQDVTMRSDILDRVFDSDTLVIATAGVGVITFDHIRSAERVRQLIFQERARAKARVAAADLAALRKNIAGQLHWEGGLKQQNVLAIAEAEGYLTHEPETHHYGRFIDYFIPRIKEVTHTDSGTIITWHKHYYILFIHTILPLLALLASVYLFIASFTLWLPPFTALAGPIQFALGLAAVASFVWFLWQYDDWSKDIYIVTNTQIIDIEASAFRLRRTRREGTFDNIQAVYSEIPNLFSKLINMGNVVIETAGTQATFTFKHVFDPASVTKEVFNRWSLYQQRERETRRDATHGQVMEVLREYHNLSGRVREI
jgi:CRP-like cAMP-binding protein